MKSLTLQWSVRWKLFHWSGARLNPPAFLMEVQQMFSIIRRVKGMLLICRHHLCSNCFYLFSSITSTVCMTKWKQKCIWDSLTVIHTKIPEQLCRAPWKFWLKANPSQFREHILNQWLKRKTSREQQELNNSDKVSVTFQQIVICSFIFLQWEVKHCSPKPLNQMICWASGIQLSPPTIKYWLCTFIHFYPIIDSSFLPLTGP